MDHLLLLLLPPQTPSTTEERGDVGYIGFWRSGRETIFDIRVTDTDAKSYLPTEVSKVLERQEKEKKGTTYSKTI